jgi:hypothetical protein
MSRDISAGVQSAISATEVQPIILFEGSFSSGTVYVWSGYGDLVWDGDTYLGVGTLGAISNVSEASEISAKGITVSMSGIPSSLISLVLGDVRQGALGKVHMGFLNSSGVVIDDPILMFEGKLDVPSIQEGGDTSTITLSYESRLIDLQRAREGRYTNEDQLRAFPGDLGCAFVASLQEKTINWGKAIPVKAVPPIDTTQEATQG